MMTGGGTDTSTVFVGWVGKVLGKWLGKKMGVCGTVPAAGGREREMFGTATPDGFVAAVDDDDAGGVVAE